MATFGNSVEGAEEKQAPPSTYFYFRPYTLSENGTAVSMSGYFKRSATTDYHAIFCIYDNAATPNLVGYTEQVTLPATGSWYTDWFTANISTCGSLVAGTYHLGFQTDAPGGSIYVMYGVDTSDIFYKTNTFPTFPATANKSLAENNQSYNIYCTYTPTPTAITKIEVAQTIGLTESKIKRGYSIRIEA